MKIRKLTTAAAVIIISVMLGSIVYSHCQIPCGIYGDPARFDTIAEHIKTVEKSMNQIAELSKAQKPNHNQIVRWVNNKDEHSDKIAKEVTYYFLAQRVKPLCAEDKGYDKYVKKVTLLHTMLVESMKCKQTADPAHVEKLRSLLVEFRAEYFNEHSDD